MTLQSALSVATGFFRKQAAGSAHANTTRSWNSRLFAGAAVGCLLFGAGAAVLPAQTVSLKTFASDPYDSFTNLIQASDGNFYGVTESFGLGNAAIAAPGCPDGSANYCDFITKITPDGMVTILHTFESDPQTHVSDGFGPSSLIEAPDGLLYGTTIEGGSSGYGTIFKVSTSGVFTTLYTFPADGSGSDPKAPSPGAPNGVSPGPLVMGNDGNFYGVSQGTSLGFGFFQLSPTGTFTMLHAPDKAETQYVSINSLMQADDGNFYAITTNRIVQITAQGMVRDLHAFAPYFGGGLGSVVLVEGADQNLYGALAFSGYDATGMENGQGIVYKVSTAGAYRELYHFTGGIDGRTPNLELTLGSDGSFYGTTYWGGNTLECNDGGPGGCGTVFKVSPTTGFSSLYKFSYDPKDGQRPYGRMLQTADGNFVGSFNVDAQTNNSAFNLSLQPALQAPIQITFSPATVNPKSSTQLTWSVLNAFSATMQQCHASIRNAATGASAGAGVWNGPQTGTLKNGVYTGTSTITPTASGTYTYVLNCGGIETGTANLTVGNGPTILTSVLPHAAVSKLYGFALQATGGITPETWGDNGSLPAGLTLDPSSGTISGTPHQYGTYQVTLGVQDSATPPQLNSATFPLIIDSTLALSGSLNSATVGAKYNGLLNAAGGFGTYKFVLASGTLPDGITLNSTTGVLSGTPTKEGKSTFSVTLTDGENPKATVTQSLVITTVVPPLSVEPGEFQDCIVNVPCDQQFVALGGTPPYTWVPVPGEIFPYGLTLSSSGELTGKPLQHTISGPLGGPYSIQVNLTDSSVPPITVSGHNELTVNSGLVITPFTLPKATIGVVYSSTAPIATGGLPPYTWMIVASDPVLLREFARLPDGSIYSPGPKTTGLFTLTYTLSDAESNPATATFVASLTVAAPPVPTATALITSASVAGTGMGITLTAKVSEAGAIPSGLVVFYNGSTALGTAMLDATGSASLTTSFSSVGAYSLTAAYSGDTASTGSVSAPLVETVVTPGVSGGVSPGSLTLTSGQTGTLILILTPTSGFTGVVSFSCGQLPPHISCTFAPPSVTIAPGATSVTDTLTINTAANSAAALEMPASTNDGSVFAALTLWLPASLLALFGLRRRPAPLPKLLGLFLLTLTLAGTLMLSGCGSASPKIMAAPGTYSIPVQLALTGGATQVITATVIVK